MTATYDLATTVGQVRLQIGDTDVTPASDAIFTDEEIQVFLDANSDNVLLASAQALESLAASTARLAKLTRTLNWTEDTRKVSEDLLSAARQLRDQEADAPAFGFAEKTYTDFNTRQIVINRSLRQD